MLSVVDPVKRLGLSLLLGAAAGCQAEPSFPVGEEQVAFDGGRYPVGSDSAERELGYVLSPPAVRVAGWYEAWEGDSHTAQVAPFALDRAPVTQAEYAAFIAATGHRVPDISAAEYERQGFLVHPYSEVEQFRWRDSRPPPGFEDHPIVLVSRDDAATYCEWRGERDGRPLRLATEVEWEAACAGRDDRTFPWGDAWRDDAAHIGADRTAPVDARPEGETPEGVREMAGNVFEWTASRMPDGRSVLKSCSWDDAPGTCRCAFRHGRPAASRHILIGFRCAAGR